jgi:hypothetical protein
MSTRKAEEMEGAVAGGSSTKRSKTNSFDSLSEKNRLSQMQFLLRRVELPPSDLLSDYAKQFKLVTYSIAMDGLYKALEAIEKQGSVQQREWVAQLKKALKVL